MSVIIITIMISLLPSLPHLLFILRLNSVLWYRNHQNPQEWVRSLRSSQNWQVTEVIKSTHVLDLLRPNGEDPSEQLIEEYNTRCVDPLKQLLDKYETLRLTFKEVIDQLARYGTLEAGSPRKELQTAVKHLQLHFRDFDRGEGGKMITLQELDDKVSVKSAER